MSVSPKGGFSISKNNLTFYTNIQQSKELLQQAMNTKDVDQNNLKSSESSSTESSSNPVNMKKRNSVNYSNVKTGGGFAINMTEHSIVDKL